MMIATLLVLVVIAAMMGVVDPRMLFPPVADAKGPGARDPNSKVFTGSGGNLLLVPGLKKVHGVRVGDVPLPAVLTEEYPESWDSNGVAKLVPHDVPLYQLVQTANGPALQRSVKSNDGIWQQGVPVYVSGDWGTGAPVETPVDDNPARAARRAELEGMKVAEAIVIANGLGFEIPAVGAKREDVVNAILGKEFPS